MERVALYRSTIWGWEGAEMDRLMRLVVTAIRSVMNGRPIPTAMPIIADADRRHAVSDGKFSDGGPVSR